MSERGTGSRPSHAGDGPRSARVSAPVPASGFAACSRAAATICVTLGSTVAAGRRIPGGTTLSLPERSSGRWPRPGIVPEAAAPTGAQPARRFGAGAPRTAGPARRRTITSTGRAALIAAPPAEWPPRTGTRHQAPWPAAGGRTPAASPERPSHGQRDQSVVVQIVRGHEPRPSAHDPQQCDLSERGSRSPSIRIPPGSPRDRGRAQRVRGGSSGSLHPDPAGVSALTNPFRASMSGDRPVPVRPVPQEQSQDQTERQMLPDRAGRPAPPGRGR